METSGYESVTFRMKPSYTQKDLARVIRMFESAFGNYTAVNPDPYFPAGGSEFPATEFTIYFRQRRSENHKKAKSSVYKQGARS
jgi:hypothetical protein